MSEDNEVRVVGDTSKLSKDEIEELTKLTKVLETTMDQLDGMKPEMVMSALLSVAIQIGVRTIPRGSELQGYEDSLLEHVRLIFRIQAAMSSILSANDSVH